MTNNENEFFNKNIVITGASSGIGLSAAFYFLNSNANVILACQDVISMNKIIKQNEFLNAVIIQADLEKKKDIEYLLSYITKLFPTIDVFINCAGIKLDSDIEKTYEKDFNYTINLNLTSIFLIIKELRPYFNQGASIINLSCLYGTRPMYGLIAYAMSKAGLETLTRYAAAELANLNIRINAISACPVDTNSLRYVKADSEIKYFKSKMKDNIPLGRIAEPDDIVKVIIFLASKRSCKVTGQIIKVDGGRSLTSSGYVHYKGLLNMNVKYEPDFINLRTFLKSLKQKEEIKLEKPITDKNELKKFVEETIDQSNFSTRDQKAHLSVVNKYYKVNEIDSFLTNRYLNGSVTNDLLLNKNGNNFGTMSFNPRYTPLNEFSKVNKKLFKSQIDKDYNPFNFKKSRNFENSTNLDLINNYENEELKINEEDNNNINNEENIATQNENKFNSLNEDEKSNKNINVEENENDDMNSNSEKKDTQNLHFEEKNEDSNEQVNINDNYNGEEKENENEKNNENSNSEKNNNQINNGEESNNENNNTSNGNVVKNSFDLEQNENQNENQNESENNNNIENN